MLLQFRFENFKTFRDDTILDMTATRISEFSDHVISVANERVLPVAAVFGANAHGKSNVFAAFRYMRKYVAESFYFGGDNDNETTKKRFMKPTPFLFDENSRNAESMFEVYFMAIDGKRLKTYNYGFTVNGNGINEEWLNYKTKTGREFKRIFYRNALDGELDLSGLPIKIQENIVTSLQKETLVVSLGAKLNMQELKLIHNWFCDQRIVDFGQPYENLALSRSMPRGFATDKRIQAQVVKYLSAFDDSIVGFDIEVVKTEDDEERYRIFALHKIANSDELTKLSLNQESSGTQKMFALFSPLQDVLKTGSVFFVDELNARLHPLLVRAFLLLFLNPETNPNHAQLIFTSHDVWQLSENGLRRDEIWFTEKNSDGVSTLYSLSDFVDEDGAKIRKDENYTKNYLLGKYGAIPSMRAFDVQ